MPHTFVDVVVFSTVTKTGRFLNNKEVRLFSRLTFYLECNKKKISSLLFFHFLKFSATFMLHVYT